MAFLTSSSDRLRVLLDTTYFLPVVSIDVPDDVLERLFSGNFDYTINEVTLFELYGKARREFRSEEDVKRFYEGMKSILSSSIKRIPIFTLDVVRPSRYAESPGVQHLPLTESRYESGETK